MIIVGENPEAAIGVNKFIAPDGEGLRGVVIALKQGGKEAVVVAQNSSTTGAVTWGCLYRVQEVDADQYPQVVEQVDCVPNSTGWTMVSVPQESS